MRRKRPFRWTIGRLASTQKSHSSASSSRGRSVQGSDTGPLMIYRPVLRAGVRCPLRDLAGRVARRPRWLDCQPFSPVAEMGERRQKQATL